MTQIFETHLDRHSATALGGFRIVVGFLFALHGTAKLFGWPATEGGTVPFGQWPLGWAALIELAVGVLVMLGVFTRPAAILGSGAMAFAYFTEHQPHGLLPIQNGGELATLYCFGFLLIAFAGAGAFALQSSGHHDRRDGSTRR